MAMSGSAFCEFSIRTKEQEAEIFRNFAKHHGYEGEDSESLLEWYKSQPLSKFQETATFEKKASGFLTFIPNFDGDFFPKPFDELSREAPKLDAMATVDEYEGLGFLTMFQSRRNDMDIIKSSFGSDVVENAVDVQKRIMEFYMKNIDKNDDKAVEKRLIQLISDSWFNIGALETVKTSTKYGSNAYLGSFDYYNMGSNDPYATWFPFKAANHGSELKYMLGEGMGKFSPIEEEFKVIDMMGTLTANFVKYGNPNGINGPELWKKYTPEKPYSYFKIDYPKSEMRDNFQDGRLKLFEDINKSSKKFQEIVYGKKL